EVLRGDGTRGAYFGYGNGSSFVNLALSDASYLNFTGGYLDMNANDIKNVGALDSNTLAVGTNDLGGYTANINGDLWADKIHTAVLVADLFKKNEVQVMKSDFLFSDGTTTTAGYVGSSFELHVKEMVFDVNDQVVISWETPTGFTKD